MIDERFKITRVNPNAAPNAPTPGFLGDAIPALQLNQNSSYSNVISEYEKRLRGSELARFAGHRSKGGYGC
jgi:hypothetical protein